MEPDTVSTPKINRNTFKIGSGDLQQQVASNTKRIRVISTMLRSSRRGRSTEGLTPQSTNIQQSLEQSNLIFFPLIISKAKFSPYEKNILFFAGAYISPAAGLLFIIKPAFIVNSSRLFI